MKTLFVYLFGCLIGFGILTWQADREALARQAAFEREAAWFETQEGRRYLDCLMVPLLASMGFERPSCPQMEQSHLADLRRQARWPE